MWNRCDKQDARKKEEINLCRREEEIWMMNNSMHDNGLFFCRGERPQCQIQMFCDQHHVQPILNCASIRNIIITKGKKDIDQINTSSWSWTTHLLYYLLAKGYIYSSWWLIHIECWRILKGVVNKWDVSFSLGSKTWPHQESYNQTLALKATKIMTRLLSSKEGWCFWNLGVPFSKILEWWWSNTLHRAWQR